MSISSDSLKPQRVVLIGSAFKAEVVNLMQLIKQRQACYPGISFDFIITGKGLDNARRRLNLKFAQNIHLLILNIGSAGAIDTKIAPLTVFWPDRFYSLVDNQLKVIQTKNDFNFSEQSLTVNWKRGTLFSSATPVISTAEREKIQESYQANAVDMEAFAYAEFCERRGIPFFCLKIITDQADSAAETSFRENLNASARILAENGLSLIDVLLNKYRTETENG